MFWENFIELCNKANKKPNIVAKEIGIASGSVTAWKQGRLPRKNMLIKIGEYFSVPIEELLSTKGNEESNDDFFANLIEAYKSHPEHQASINALLGISSADNVTKLASDSKPVYVAAASGNEQEAKEPDIKTIIEIEKLQKKNNK